MKSFLISVLLIIGVFTTFVKTNSTPTTTERIPFITYDEYDRITSQSGIVVVEFWAAWNREQEHNLIDLQRAKKYRVNADREYDLIYEMEVEFIPTVFIYKDGVLRHIDEVDITFKRNKPEGHLQVIVDELYYE